MYKRKNEFNSHGETFQNYIMDKPVIRSKTSKYKKEELLNSGAGYLRTNKWIKVVYLIVDWYIKDRNQNKEFFCSYKSIISKMARLGCHVTLSCVQKAVKNAEQVGLFKREYAADKKTASEDPKNWKFRIIHLNWKELFKILGCCSTESNYYKSLPSKSRIKKLIKQRPITSRKGALESYKLALRGKYTKATTQKEFELEFRSSNSSLYYNTKKLDFGKRPEYMIDQQEKEDRAFLNDDYKRSKGRLGYVVNDVYIIPRTPSPDDVYSIQNIFKKMQKN